MDVALVTGSSSGIGAAIAIALAEDGWEVMAAGRDEARLAEVADVSDDIATWAGELATADDCEELVADTIDEFGRLDCLVNCAGILLRGDATEIGDDDWRETMTINLDVPFYLSRAALPHLVTARGSIINIASNLGLHAGARRVAYSTSKAGLIMLTRAMARDHAHTGIRVNAICPGAVDTPMLADGALEARQDVDAFLDRVAAGSPNGRIAAPEDVASLVLFLAGRESRHITGTAIPIDGGLSA
jgi:NAD(P)-dependent dehydrogenase (short-subunit alcohol dehydrogenase family)